MLTWQIIQHTVQGGKMTVYTDTHTQPVAQNLEAHRKTKEKKERRKEGEKERKKESTSGTSLTPDQ